MLFHVTYPECFETHGMVFIRFYGKDWEIVFGSKSDFNVASIYDKWDPLIIGVDNIQPLIDNTTAE
jgi:hypothetical protein